MIDDVINASEYILLKSFLWRNDEAGKEVALELLKAADRGVKIYIIKDKRGAIYEYSRGNGQCFFHSDLNDSLFIFLQSKLVSAWYGNSPKLPKKNELYDEFANHKNVRMVSSFDIRDHSKVIIVDGKFSLMGSSNIGNEFHHEFGPENERMLDCNVRIHGRSEAVKLLKTLAGVLDNGDGYDFLHEDKFQDGHKLHDDFTNFINGTRQELSILMAYHS